MIGLDSKLMAHDMALVQLYAFYKPSSKSKTDPILTLFRLMEGIKELVTFVKKSGTTKLRRSVDTRWDSQWDMIDSVLKNIDTLKDEP